MAARKTAAQRTRELLENSSFSVPGHSPQLRKTQPDTGDSYPVETPWGKIDVAALLRTVHSMSVQCTRVIARNEALAKQLQGFGVELDDTEVVRRSEAGLFALVESEEAPLTDADLKKIGREERSSDKPLIGRR